MPYFRVAVVASAFIAATAQPAAAQNEQSQDVGVSSPEPGLAKELGSPVRASGLEVLPAKLEATTALQAAPAGPIEVAPELPAAPAGPIEAVPA